MRLKRASITIRRRAHYVVGSSSSAAASQQSVQKAPCCRRHIGSGCIMAVVTILTLSLLSVQDSSSTTAGVHAAWITRAPSPLPSSISTRRRHQQHTTFFAGQRLELNKQKQPQLQYAVHKAACATTAPTSPLFSMVAIAVTARKATRTTTTALDMVSTSTAPEAETSSSSSSSSSASSRSSSSSSSLSSSSSTFDISSLLGDDGIYHITTQQEHKQFIQANRDKLVILKVFAPWCRACKGLEPKFIQLMNDEKYVDLPLVFCDLTIQHNKDFVKQLGVIALPTIQFYVGGALYDTFANGPSKFPILKKKVSQLIKDHVDSKTRLVKPESMTKPLAVPTSSTKTAEDDEEDEDSAAMKPNRFIGTENKIPIQKSQVNATTATTTKLSRTFATTPPPTASASGTTAASIIRMSEYERQLYRRSIPYLSQLSLADLDSVLDKAQLQSFEPGSIILRQGDPGSTFYIIQNGSIEICQEFVGLQDPLLQTPSSYLGTVINRLERHDYFGERALITGEPRAASIRATRDSDDDVPVTCWTLDKDDFPWSSPLSGRTRINQQDNKDLYIDDKYGVDEYLLEQKSLEKQMQQVQLSNQIRGSVNRPQKIKGVDDDEELDELFNDKEDEEEDDSSTLDYDDNDEDDMVTRKLVSSHEDDILHVLTRFQLIRHVSRCLDYILQSPGIVWGNDGIRKRRNMLVSRLTMAQRDTFSDAFALVDADNDGRISLAEFARVISSDPSDNNANVETTLSPLSLNMANGTMTNSAQVMIKRQELLQQLLKKQPMMTKQDFMGLMAEAEFYNLFRDIFSSLDQQQSGFVKAKELNRVLCGVRDLISDNDRRSSRNRKSNSIIDVDDDEMLIDYEKFSRMLLGSTLL